jgi:monooxygenase
LISIDLPEVPRSMTVPETTAASGDVRDAGHVDFLIVGAGISGIGAAHHMRERFPGRSLIVLEGRERHGGTWWTHRYPGVRSDSDLYTYGYRFKPWRGPAIASGPAILDYLDELITEDGLGSRIRYRHRVTSATWSTADRRWTVEVTRGDTGERLRYTAGFLWMCAGYYDHDRPHQPQWDGLDRFRGLVVHPQRWPQDLDVTGQRVIVIGSGATAATLIPAIARDAAHVTMVQRSPSYFLAPPGRLELAETLASLDIPADWTHEILRRAYIARSDELVKTAFEAPGELHRFFIESMRPQLPEDFDIDRHFTPRYRPWQQRIGLVPEGDFFTALRSGKASIVTDTIETFTETGLRVSSGEEISADIVVTATGFTMSLFGGITFAVDGEPVDFTERVTWRGLMISGVPSMAYVFGYLRYSWTLRADLVCDLVARMLERMETAGATMVVPALRPQDAGMERRPFCDPENFSAGYILRSQDTLFRQGDREPWTHMHEYYQERDTLPAADLDDGSLLYR